LFFVVRSLRLSLKRVGRISRRPNAREVEKDRPLAIKNVFNMPASTVLGKVWGFHGLVCRSTKTMDESQKLKTSRKKTNETLLRRGIVDPS
jgi:hypothetical protein